MYVERDINTTKKRRRGEEGRTAKRFVPAKKKRRRRRRRFNPGKRFVLEVAHQEITPQRVKHTHTSEPPNFIQFSTSLFPAHTLLPEGRPCSSRRERAPEAGASSGPHRELAPDLTGFPKFKKMITKKSKKEQKT